MNKQSPSSAHGALDDFLRRPDPAFIEAFLDGECGMCRSFADWIQRQPRAFPVRFLAYQSEAARRAVPDLDQLEPGRLMIARDDRGLVYRGAEAWVLCLHSCANHRPLARRLATPALLPFAKRACTLLAANRRRLSRLLFRRREREIRLELERRPDLDPDCTDGRCRLPTAAAGGRSDILTLPPIEPRNPHHQPEP